MNLNLYEIRLCKKEEFGKLRDFIHDYWKKDHIFCKSKEIFEFQHGKAENGYYDFVIAVHKDTGEIHAVLGFIRTSLYDGTDRLNPQAIYGALWKVRADVKNKEIGKLGLGVLYYLIKSFPSSSYITLGLSHFSQDIYTMLHFNFGKMKHYYIANPAIQTYKILKNPKQTVVKYNDRITIRKLKDAEDVDSDFYPVKSKRYLQERYFQHPIYSYALWGVFLDGQLVSEWVIRPVKVGAAICLQIVDMIGSLNGLTGLNAEVLDLLKENHAEYIDCYNYGIESEIFKQMGFLEVDDGVVIPAYFEPFEQRNIDIHYASDGKRPVVIFKGDGDQDRPSILQ